MYLFKGCAGSECDLAQVLCDAGGTGRGFAGDRLEWLLALFRRHGVQVWLPEAGDPVDPEGPERRALVRMPGVQSLREVVRCSASCDGGHALLVRLA